MWNFVQAGLKLAGTGFQAYGNIKSTQANAQAIAMQAGADASNLLHQGEIAKVNADINALNYDAQSEYYLRQAGQYQLQGQNQRAARGLQLGEEKGRIRSGAAGSGIEVNTSRVVEKTLADTTLSAYRDMEIMARNEYEAAHGALKNSKISEVNASNQRAIGDWQKETYGKLANQVISAGRKRADNALEIGYINAFNGIIQGTMSAAGSAAGAFM